MVHDFRDQTSRDKGLSEADLVCHEKTCRRPLSVHPPKHVLDRVPLEVPQPEKLLSEVRADKLSRHANSLRSLVVTPRLVPITVQNPAGRSQLNFPPCANQRSDLQYGRAVQDFGPDCE